MLLPFAILSLVFALPTPMQASAVTRELAMAKALENTEQVVIPQRRVSALTQALKLSNNMEARSAPSTQVYALSKSINGNTMEAVSEPAKSLSFKPVSALTQSLIKESAIDSMSPRLAEFFANHEVDIRKLTHQDVLDGMKNVQQFIENSKMKLKQHDEFATYWKDQIIDEWIKTRLEVAVQTRAKLQNRLNVEEHMLAELKELAQNIAA